MQFIASSKIFICDDKTEITGRKKQISAYGFRITILHLTRSPVYDKCEQKSHLRIVQ